MVRFTQRLQSQSHHYCNYCFGNAHCLYLITCYRAKKWASRGTEHLTSSSNGKDLQQRLRRQTRAAVEDSEAWVESKRYTVYKVCARK